MSWFGPIQWVALIVMIGLIVVWVALKRRQ